MSKMSGFAQCSFAPSHDPTAEGSDGRDLSDSSSLRNSSLYTSWNSKFKTVDWC